MKLINEKPSNIRVDRACFETLKEGNYEHGLKRKAARVNSSDLRKLVVAHTGHSSQRCAGTTSRNTQLLQHLRKRFDSQVFRRFGLTPFRRIHNHSTPHILPAFHKHHLWVTIDPYNQTHAPHIEAVERHFSAD